MYTATLYRFFFLSPSAAFSPLTVSVQYKHFLSITFHIWSSVILLWTLRGMCFVQLLFCGTFCDWRSVHVDSFSTWSTGPHTHKQGARGHVDTCTGPRSPEARTLSFVFRLLFRTGATPLAVQFSRKKRSWSLQDANNGVAVVLPQTHADTHTPPQRENPFCRSLIITPWLCWTTLHSLRIRGTFF